MSSIREAFRSAVALYNSSRTRKRQLKLVVEPERFDPERKRFTYLGLPIPNPSGRLGGSPNHDEYLEVVLRVSFEYPLQLKHFEERLEDTEARIVECRVRDPHTVYRTFIFFAAPGFRRGVEDLVEDYNTRNRKENKRIILVDLRKKTLRQAVLETLVIGVDRGEDGRPLKPYLGSRVWEYLKGGGYERSDNMVFGPGKDFVDLVMLLIAFLKRLDGDRATVEEALDRLKIAANVEEYDVEGYRGILRTLVGDLDRLGTGMGRAAKPVVGVAKPEAKPETVRRGETPQTDEDLLLLGPDDPSRWEPVEDSEEVVEE
ncbi:MAG: hypothetical protein BA066_07640 [Candidatus Korarchaeota archaeon NZ13-K]|nr:MAG: hypothetical protein BA066_07640 [Candidatus Korarchaeota archaeon NZ13-K]